MDYQSGPPTNGPMLRRPRVHGLIHDGLQQPLLVMLAGPGYGKTQAMAAYAEGCGAQVLWMRLGVLDNLPNHFWEHLVQSLARAYPEFSARLQELEFPDTISGFDTFARLLARDICGHGPVIWVFDDYGEVENRQVKDFFRMLVEANLADFHMVLMSNVLNRTESIAFLTSRRTLLLANDLRFTREETQQLYLQYGITLEAEELDAVEAYTEGWPLPLHLLVLQHDRLPDLLHQDERLTHHTVSHLFEERFFSTYPLRQQKLLVQLSMLDSFTKRFAIDLYSGPATELQELGNHAFLISEPSTNRFFLHHLYRLFLQEKSYLLNPEEEAQLWRQAAEYCIKTGNYIDAISSFRKCGDHIGMLYAIRDFVRLQHGIQAHGITPENALFFLEHLDLLLPQEVEEYPVADYLRALVYLNTMQLEKAETLFAALEQRLLADGSETALELLGDVYAMTGALHMMRNQEDFGEYYKKAAALLPNGTQLQNKKSLLIQNNHNFAMQDNSPGAKQRLEAAMHDGIPWANKVLGGGMGGFEHMYSAEAAYLSFQLEDARQHAYRAVYRAEPLAQHDVVCNAYYLLARIALLEGNLAEITQQIENVKNYAGKFGIGVLNDIRDTLLSWYYIKMHDYKRTPKSILTLDQSDKPILSQGRLVIIYANYLVNTGEYARLVGMLEHPTGLYLTGGIWHDRIYLLINLAIGHLLLGNQDAALKALWQAYDMTYNNGLVTPFIETEGYMARLASLASRQDTYSFDPSWLGLVEREAAAAAKRADAVRAAYRRQNPTRATAKDNPLSKREQDVLQAVARGLTREEIAIEQYISVNTVKSTIRNIYNKLGASNKGDAVSIAITNGYIDGHTLR